MFFNLKTKKILFFISLCLILLILQSFYSNYKIKKEFISITDAYSIDISEYRFEQIDKKEISDFVEGKEFTLYKIKVKSSKSLEDINKNNILLTEALTLINSNFNHSFDIGNIKNFVYRKKFLSPFQLTKNDYSELFFFEEVNKNRYIYIFIKHR